MATHIDKKVAWDEREDLEFSENLTIMKNNFSMMQYKSPGLDGILNV